MMMVSGLIHTDQRILGDLFSNPITGESYSSFQIPRFQRKCEWEKEEQVLRLVTDVFDNVGQTYFMGPLIFCQEDPQSKQIEIVGGQQRLITFSIFYRAFADTYEEEKMREHLLKNHIL